MSYMQLGAVDDKLKSTVLKVTDKLGVTSYLGKLFTTQEPLGVPMTTPEPAAPAEEPTPWMEYGLMARAGLLIYKVLFK